jgi:hypothetical protein
MALADLDPPTDNAAGGRFVRRGGDREQPDAASAGGRFVGSGGDREPTAAAAAPLPGTAEPLAVPSPAPSARDAEVRRAARARQAVVARWLRQLSR